MIDVNIRGVLCGIAAALPVMQAQGSGHVITVSSVAGHKVGPGFAVYCGTNSPCARLPKGSVRKPGRTSAARLSPRVRSRPNCRSHISAGPAKDAVDAMYATAEISADAVAGAIVYAISQTPDVDVNEIIIRPTAQTF
ncbi:SDR family NAD(P)-dependent oxidoreductase [Komagataeibacter rhaeticus]|nr:SDR family NAD(P)-dependent oxidoreductase [Komagataeibacter rhaeticus]